MSGVMIIAEAGVNHNGNLDIAKKMVDVAVQGGVDAIKFQTFHAENLVCKNAEKAEYQKQTTEKNESQFDMLKKLELTEDMHRELISYCQQRKILFMSTPFDIDSIELLRKFDLDVFKIPSGEVTNYPYLKRMASLNKKLILSTGMCDIDEIRNAIQVLRENGAPEIIILHCNTQYPTPMNDVNLKAMLTIKEQTGLEVGYSDHTLGIEVPIAAVALGATVIEKHFTLDNSMEGPDHKASLEPSELAQMVQAIRNIEKCLGNGIKRCTESELDNRMTVRKSIVASRDIKCGELLSEENITTKRPGNGISAMRWNEVLGQKACRDFREDELIEV